MKKLIKMSSAKAKIKQNVFDAFNEIFYVFTPRNISDFKLKFK